MTPEDEDRLRVVLAYHERTKHQPDRYAASLGYMDWANQPNPFRAFAGTRQIDLPHPDPRPAPSYDALYAGAPAPMRLDSELISRLFFNSLALSAWKQAPGTSPWSLRVNPSSGNLHPTEAYLITGPIDGLIKGPGIFHYAPYLHCLEGRGRLPRQEWSALIEGLPDPCLLIVLTSIYWRESWKYGERAFRYCNHDVGHAIGAVDIAARSLGWEARLVDDPTDEALSRLVGAHLQSGIEAEHADCLIAVYPSDTELALRTACDTRLPQRLESLAEPSFEGQPNELSLSHQDWPVIGEVSEATRRRQAQRARTGSATSSSEPAARAVIGDREQPAEQIIRQRRSAVDMDGASPIARSAFYQMLRHTLPGRFPLSTLPWAPYVSLAIFVHRVADLDPGLYLLAREPAHEESLRASLKPELEWHRPDECPADLRLYRLLTADARHAAKLISCHQDIAADGAFALGMLAQLDTALRLEGPHQYPRLFWETGLIGQVLYLEAEAAGVRATGIGCFFDDLMHQVLGISDRSWQSLYHFTVGGPIEDKRLQTIGAYHHVTGGIDRADRYGEGAL